MEEKVEVTPIIHRYRCDSCRIGFLQIVPKEPSVILSTPSYLHQCSNCKKTFNLPKPYPQLEYMPVKESVEGEG
jgi:hypothetical protein